MVSLLWLRAVSIFIDETADAVVDPLKVPKIVQRFRMMSLNYLGHQLQWREGHRWKGGLDPPLSKGTNTLVSKTAFLNPQFGKRSDMSFA
jgi:hypothetical protein